MEYITAAEAAKKWGVTLRQVQRLLAANRIQGSKKYHRSWLVPADAQKPVGKRGQRPQRSLTSDLVKILEATTLPMPLDNPDAVFDTITEERLRLHYESEIAYLRGDFERIKECFRKTEGDNASRLRASSAAIVAAISTGDYPFYLELESYLKSVIQKSNDESVIAFAELGLATAYMSAAAPNMAPDWLKNGEFTHLHDKVKPTAVYLRVKYFQAIHRFESMLDVAQTALTFCDYPERISLNDIYLRVTCAWACYALEREDEAKRWLLNVMKIALPHGFITPFAESATAFGGLLEELLESEYPAYYDDIMDQWKRTFKNWLVFHNRFTTDNITLILSMRDYEIAVLAAKGIPNKKIAEHFHMSQGRLRNKIGEIYAELHVDNRDKLAKLIL